MDNTTVRRRLRFPPRQSNTGREMVQSGAWVKLGKQHYQHITGAEIRYDCNRWVWAIVGTDLAYSLLWAARYQVEKTAAEGK